MKKKLGLDHLFVSSDEMLLFMAPVWGRVQQRAYELFVRRGGVDGRDFDDWIEAESELLQPVTAEISDAGNAFIAIAAVTRYRPEDLRISVEPQCVTICGLAPREEKNPSFSDNTARLSGFNLSFKLPADINTSAATADLRRDLLEIRLPKLAAWA